MPEWTMHRVAIYGMVQRRVMIYYTLNVAVTKFQENEELKPYYP